MFQHHPSPTSMHSAMPPMHPFGAKKKCVDLAGCCCRLAGHDARAVSPRLWRWSRGAERGAHAALDVRVRCRHAGPSASCSRTS
jgi:hypothetical protein